MSRALSSNLPAAILLFTSALLSNHCVALYGQELCRTVAGDVFGGLLVGVDEDDGFVFDTNTGTQTVSPDDLFSWNALRDSAAGTQVLLADGSLIVASDVALEGESLLVDADLFGEPQGFSIAGRSKLPISSVRAIIFRVPLVSLERDVLFQKIADHQDAEDQLWLANGDLVQGTLTSLGRAESDDQQAGAAVVSLKAESGDVTISADSPQRGLLDKVTAVVFNPQLLRPVRNNQPHTLAGFADGSRLRATALKPSGERIEYSLLCGVSITSHADLNGPRQITSLQSFGHTQHYLADQKLVEYRHIPLLERTWPLGVNENVLGGRLRSVGNMYVQGIGMHSRSRARFALDQPYSKFQAEVAIDESAGHRGSATVVVLSDASGKFKITGEPIPIRGGKPPVSISVDISGAKNIALFVESADHGTQLDRANWLNARLIK